MARELKRAWHALRLAKEDMSRCLASVSTGELANEPHTSDHYETSRGLKPGSLVNGWICQMSSFVKTLDSKHLVRELALVVDEIHDAVMVFPSPPFCLTGLLQLQKLLCKHKGPGVQWNDDCSYWMLFHLVDASLRTWRRTVGAW